MQKTLLNDKWCNVVSQKKLVTVLVGVILLLAVGCGMLRPAWPLLYKPTCDLAPVLSLHLPEYIDTLAACPRDKTFVTNGINISEGRRSSENKKEFFRLGKDHADYEFVVYYDEAAAQERYVFEKQTRYGSKYYPVYREVKTNGISACLRYTEQDRADPEGGSLPSGVYRSRVAFQFHNVFVSVTTEDNTPRSDKLSKAVADLAQMLEKAINSKSNSIRQP